MRKRHPTPWRLEIDEVGPQFTDTPIMDANGAAVVVTDSGCYPPDNETAREIVEAVNERDKLRDLVKRLAASLEDAIEVIRVNSTYVGPFLPTDCILRGINVRELVCEAREAIGEGNR